VHQEHTAMKVCTDACLFGAWLSKDQNLLSATSLLDIGTGTGLLSLMVAQALVGKGPAIQNTNEPTAKTISISALEIEPTAAAEATRNIQLSPWSKHIQVFNQSLQEYVSASLKSSNHLSSDLSSELSSDHSMNAFDCIFTNPPFFEGDLQSPNAHKNLAAHSTALPWQTLIENVKLLLKEDGYYYVLIPAIRAYTMQKLADQNGLKLEEEVVVFNAAAQKPFRVIQKYKKTATPFESITRSNFIIKEMDQSYSHAFTSLLKDYYLHL
jgi:tRNA1Val (adenine37-N6)-methyltransferase